MKFVNGRDDIRRLAANESEQLFAAAHSFLPADRATNAFGDAHAF